MNWYQILSHVKDQTNIKNCIIYFKRFKSCSGSMILRQQLVLLDFSLTVKAATLIFISGCGLANSPAKVGKSGFIYNLVNS